MTHRSLARGLAALTLLLSAPAALAQSAQLTGFVRNAQGTGIPSVNIDVLNDGSGGDPTVSNDSTDGTGAFNVTVDPGGVYRVLFKPPPPPSTTYVIRELVDVNVTGTTNLGVVTLEQGVSLTARILGPTGVPLANVDIDVEAGGQNVPLQGDTTNSLGMFTVAVPTGPIELLVDPSALGQTIAPARLELSLNQNTNLGDIQLETGYLITGIVRNPAGTPVNNADFDAIDLATGQKLYTPGDNSNSTGFVDFVVPAGTYDLEVCPPPGVALVPRLISGVTVSGSTSLGIVTLANGFFLTGNVVSHLGATVQNVDVDVKDLATGEDLLLCSDNTNAAGNYSVVVPAGSYKVTFSPPYSLPLGAEIVQPVNVSGNMTLNAVLPRCDFYVNTGTGTAGTGGLVPGMTASGGTPRLGNSNYALEVSNARGGSKALLIVGVGSSCPDDMGWYGPLLAHGSQGRVLMLSGSSGAPGAGAATVPMPVPGSPASAGLILSARAWVVDPLAPGGFAISRQLCALICE